MIKLPERKALLWFQKHEPADWPALSDPDSPTRKIFENLCRAGLIQVNPKRSRFEPFQYVLSPIGREALELI